MTTTLSPGVEKVRAAGLPAAAGRRILRERAAWALAVAVLATTLLCAGRSQRQQGLPKDAFFIEKLSWRHCADVVIGGDSRVQAAVAPTVLAGELPAGRVCNFSFGGLGFSAAYLAALQDVLDPAGPTRAVVLGISPANFTTGYVQENQFTEYRGRTAPQRFMIRHCGRLLEWTRPFGLAELAAWLQGAGARPGRQVYHADGWVATRDVPARYDGEIRKHETFFDHQHNGPVQDDHVAGLLDAVCRWTQAGITVYGFRPPVCAEVRRLEDERSGFDEMRFRARFTEAGGCWLTLAPGAYQTYDGSHLDRESAWRLSRALVAAIRTQQAGAADESLAQLPVGR